MKMKSTLAHCSDRLKFALNDDKYQVTLLISSSFTLSVIRDLSEFSLCLPGFFFLKPGILISLPNLRRAQNHIGQRKSTRPSKSNFYSRTQSPESEAMRGSSVDSWVFAMQPDGKSISTTLRVVDMLLICQPMERVILLPFLLAREQENDSKGLETAELRRTLRGLRRMTDMLVLMKVRGVKQYHPRMK